MSKGFGDLITAQEIDRYTTKKISNELVKQRPGPKYAIVKSIDNDSGIAEVSYVGEDSIVKVPFGIAAPTEIGQEVRIEGVPGDRFITSVRGTTAVEQSVEDNADQIEQNKTDIFDALLGNYLGNDNILLQLQEWAAGLGGAVVDFIGSIFNGGGLFNLGQLTTGSINLISYEGQFDIAKTVKIGEGWSWDGDIGHGAPGCAKFSGADAIGGVLTPPTPARVEPGKNYTASAWAKWADLLAVGTIAVDVKWYRADKTEISTVEATRLQIGGSGDWSPMSGDIVAPPGAYWAAVFLRADGDVSEGVVWFDDVGLYSEQASLPQMFIANLPQDLQNLFGWLENLVDQLLGVFGLSGVGSLFDKIFDLTDEFDAWFGDSQGLLGSFDDLVGNLLNDPLSVIGTLPQQIISGLPQALNDLANNFGGILQSLLGDYTGSNSDLLGIQDWASGISGLVDGAVNAAVDAVVNGMNGIGAFANAITAAISAAIQSALGAIFGDGGTKWGQEVLVASGPVTTGPNDIPLGFGMPFSGKITDLEFYSSEHLAVGSGSSATIEVRKNGTTIQTVTWNGGTSSRVIGGLNLSVARSDRITFWVTNITSQMANMSASVMGKYV